jgi:mannonate dehydratase
MLDYDSLPMRVAMGQIRELTDDVILFTKQLGIQDIQFNLFHGSPHLSGETHWDYMELVRLRTRCDDAGLRLNAIENVPIKFYDKVMLGQPGRDERLDAVDQRLRAVRVLLAEVVGAGRQHLDRVVPAVPPTRVEEVHDRVVALRQPLPVV